MEHQVVPAAAALGVGMVPYAPLGRGFLTGKVKATDLGPDDFRHNIPRFAPDAIAANQHVVASVKGIAYERWRIYGDEATAAHVALAWLYAQAKVFKVSVVPIPGTRKSARIDENAEALDLVLNSSQVQRLNQAGAAVVGLCAKDPSWVSQGRE